MSETLRRSRRRVHQNLVEMMCVPVALVALGLTISACDGQDPEPAPPAQQATPVTDSTVAQDTSPAPDAPDSDPGDSPVQADSPIGPEPDPNPGPEFPADLESDLLSILSEEFAGMAAPGATLTVVLPGHRRFEAAIG